MSYRAGADEERTVRLVLEAGGSLVERCAGSKGPSGADLIEFRYGKKPRLIQVKRTKTMWSGFGPAERRKMLDAAERYDVDVILCWRPPGGNRTWVPPECWPNIRT